MLKLVRSSRPLSLIVALLLLTLGTSCGDTRIEQSSISPDKRHAAEIEQDREAFLTAGSTFVNLRRVQPSVMQRMTGRDKARMFSLTGPGNLRVEWRSANELLIKCNPCPDPSVMKLKSAWDGVTILYDVAPMQWHDDAPK